MSDPIKPGDRVKWNSSKGQVEGKVKKKLTQPIEVKGHHVAASVDHPEFLVESEKSGAQAAHKASALKKNPARKGDAS